MEFQGILIPVSNEHTAEQYLAIVRAELVRLHMSIHGTREEACQAIGVSSRQEREWDRSLSFNLPIPH